MNWILRGIQVRYYDADKGAGNGGGTSDGDGKNSGDQKTDNGDQKKDAGAEDDKGKKKEEPKFTQADIDAAVQKRLDREKNKADEDKKKAQGEFEALFNTEKTKSETLETENTSLKQTVESLTTAFNAGINTQIKDWPEEVKAMDPGEENIVARQQWAEKASAVVAAMGGKGTKKVDGENGKKTDTQKPNPVTQIARNTYKGPVLLNQ